MQEISSTWRKFPPALVWRKFPPWRQFPSSGFPCLSWRKTQRNHPSTDPRGAGSRGAPFRKNSNNPTARSHPGPPSLSRSGSLRLWKPPRLRPQNLRLYQKLPAQPGPQCIRDCTKKNVGIAVAPFQHIGNCIKQLLALPGFQYIRDCIKSADIAVDPAHRRLYKKTNGIARAPAHQRLYKNAGAAGVPKGQCFCRCLTPSAFLAALWGLAYFFWTKCVQNWARELLGGDWEKVVQLLGGDRKQDHGHPMATKAWAFRRSLLHEI